MRNLVIGALLLPGPAGTVSGQEVTPTARVGALQPALGEPLAGLSSAELERFQLGKDAYVHGVTPAEGAGPNLTQFACSICHANPIGGVGGSSVAHFGRVENGVFDPLEHLGGSQWQMLGIGGCPEVLPSEANVLFTRKTPGALGYGLIEAIDEADLLALEAAPPSALVSGRAHRVAALEDPAGSPLRVGRFGWKAILPTVLSFSADAARNEVGVTNRLIPTEPPPNGNTAILPTCDPVADPDVGPVIAGLPYIDRVTDFQRLLAAPPQTPRSGMAGEALFAAIGCADCHVATFTTRDDPTLERALRAREIRPYSDFLLHDMGELADFPQGDAGAGEFRTTPLWGMRERTFLLHDGRATGTLADRVTQAIAWHDTTGSEAAPAAQAFAALPQAQKDQLIAFLDSLGRREFDFDGDGDVDAADRAAFQACRGGPCSPDDPCAVFDFDQDGDVDGRDESFLCRVLPCADAAHEIRGPVPR